MISYELDDDTLAIQDTVKKFAETELRANLRDLEKDGKVSDKILQNYHELGLSMLEIPEEYGGMGLDLRTRMVVEEELAFGDAGATWALSGPGEAASAILAFGNEEQKKKFLTPFAEPEAFNKCGAVAFLEAETGKEYFDMTVTAEKKGDSYILNGTKTFVVNGGNADLTVVFAKVSGEGDGWDGVKAFVVEGETKGMEAGEREGTLGFNTLTIADITFTDCSIPAANLLSGEEETETGLRNMANHWRPICSARSVGLARASYEYALAYAQERKAFFACRYGDRCKWGALDDMARRMGG